MRNLFLTILFVLSQLYTLAQCDKVNYDKLIGEGDQFMANQDYLKAYCRYKAAKSICPDNNEKTKQKIASAKGNITQLKIEFEPKVTWGGKRGGKVSMAWFISQIGPSLEYPSGMDCDLGYVIAGFTLSIFDRQGNVYDAKTDGPRFNVEQIKLFEKVAEPGQKIFIENIRVKRNDGLIANFGSLVFTIH